MKDKHIYVKAFNIANRSLSALLRATKVGDFLYIQPHDFDIAINLCLREGDPTINIKITNAIGFGNWEIHHTEKHCYAVASVHREPKTIGARILPKDANFKPLTINSIEKQNG